MSSQIEGLATADMERLQKFAAQIDAVQKNIDELNSMKGKIYAQVRSAGLDAKVLKRVVKDRGRDSVEYHRDQSTYAKYALALGLFPQEPAATTPSRVHARESQLE